MKLPVTHGHVLHYAEYGNPAGIPLLFVHGGPGSACNPAHTPWLYPQGFRIIQLDQRGCGQSTPAGGLLGNRTTHLLLDMETLRQHLGITRWVIYGGSWGATLALEYAKQYPLHVQALLLRGVFLARQEDWEWFSLPHGVAQQFPAAYQALLHTLQPVADENPINSLYRHLQNPHTPQYQAYRYALAWDTWECAVMGLPAPTFTPDASIWQARINNVRIYSHYCYQQFFLPALGVMARLEALHTLPVILVHGLHDQVCRHASAVLLAKALPNSQLVSADAGHGMHAARLQQTLLQTATTLYERLSACGHYRSR